MKLVRAGAKPHWGWVCETMREGHLRLAKLLFELGVVRNVFTMAATCDLASLARKLRRTREEARRTASMEPGCRDVTPLHVGCASDWRSYGQERMRDQVTLAQILKDHGADLNARAQYRNLGEASPLFCACWTSENVALVQWLLGNGAKASDRDFAAALGHFQRHARGAYDIAQVLLAWGLPIDGASPRSRTPLQGFAHHGAFRAVAWLVAHGADVNARTPAGRTAAHFAAERNTGTRIIKLLADHGADLNVRDDDGNTPLDLAQHNEKQRVAAWIKRRRR